MRTTLVALLFLLVIPGDVFAETAGGRGHTIAVEAKKRNSNFGDYQVQMTMILRSRAGAESQRMIRNRVLEIIGDGDKSLTIFDSPTDVRGTALLSYSHRQGDDDQWLYLPALKRVKRISSADKSGSFMGSEFSYEDLGSREVEKYAYRFLQEEACGEQRCFVLELIPKESSKSGYSRIISWLDTVHLRTMKEEYHDTRGRLMKTLTMGIYQEYLGFHWRPMQMLMVNHQNGKETELLFYTYLFHTGLTDRDFNKSKLQRLR